MLFTKPSVLSALAPLHMTIGVKRLDTIGVKRSGHEIELNTVLNTPIPVMCPTPGVMP